MWTKLRCTFLLLLLVSTWACNERPKSEQIFILWDDSTSSPVVKYPTFAEKTGEFLYRQITKLPMGSTVEVIPFGSFVREDYTTYRWKLQRKPGATRKAVGAKVRAYFASIPERVKSGEISSSHSSSILSALWKISPKLQPQNILFLITDGLEYPGEGKRGVNLFSILKSGKGSLPGAREGSLSGVNVVIIGLGIHTLVEPRQLRLLETLWLEYFKPTGANVKIFNDSF